MERELRKKAAEKYEPEEFHSLGVHGVWRLGFQRVSLHCVATFSEGQGCVCVIHGFAKFLELEQEEDSSTRQFLFSPSSKAMVLNPGQLHTPPPGNIWQCLETSLVVPTSDGGASSGQRLEMLLNICNAQDSSHYGEVPGSIVPRLRYGGGN